MALSSEYIVSGFNAVLKNCPVGSDMRRAICGDLQGGGRMFYVSRGAMQALHKNGIKAPKLRKEIKRLSNRRNRHFHREAVTRILHGDEDTVEKVDRFTEWDTN